MHHSRFVSQAVTIIAPDISGRTLSFVAQNALGPTCQELYHHHDFNRRVFIQLMMEYH